MEDEVKISYVQTHGVDEPSKAATPFYPAAAAVAMDIEVSTYPRPRGRTRLHPPYGSYRPSEPIRDYPGLPNTPDDLVDIRD